MLKHFRRLIPFKEHPLFRKVANNFDNLAASQNSKLLLTTNLDFIYPKTLVFSLCSYYNDTADMISYEHDDEKDYELMFEKRYMTKGPIISAEHGLEFISVLVESLKYIEFEPIIVLNLIGIETYDQIMTESICSDIVSIGFNLMVLAPSGLTNVFESSEAIKQEFIVPDLEHLYHKIDMLALNDQYVLDITLDSNMSIRLSH